MGWLAQRHWQPEIMDQEELDPQQHLQALRGLSRINWWSHTAGILWTPLRELAQELHPRPVRVLDLATGAGDLPIRLWRKAQRQGYNLEFAGSDVSYFAVEHARRSVARAGAKIDFFVQDALQGKSLPGYDVVMNSQFLHHQKDDQRALTLLRRMAEMAGRMVLLHDLIRSPLNLMLAHAATRVMSRSPVVHTDGPRSVEAAFTPEEVQQLAEEAGLNGATVERHWPFRLLLIWKRPVNLKAVPGNKVPYAHADRFAFRSPPARQG